MRKRPANVAKKVWEIFQQPLAGGEKAVEDYRSPRRFATVEGGGKGPPGFGLRRSSGALAWARARGEGTIKPSSPPRAGKAVEDYRTPRRFARIEAAGGFARFWTAPVLWRFSSPFQRGIEVVGQIELIGFEPVDGLDLRD